MISIRNRLLAWLGAAVVVGGLSFVLVSYFFTLDEISEVMDESLKQVAVAMASYGETGNLHPPRERTHWPLPNEPRDEYDVVTMTWNAAGELTYSSEPQTHLPPGSRTGASMLKTPEGDWHLFTIADANGVVIAAQRASSRRVMAVESAQSLLLPLFALIVLMGLTVVVVLNLSLSPLEAASRDVESRNPNALHPLDLSLQPLEVQPLGKAINALLQRISIAFEARQRFVADAAHELRSPITALRLQLQLLERSTSPADQAARLAGLKAGMARSQRLMNQMLDLSRVDADPAVLKREPVDLAALARSVVSTLYASAEDRGIDLGVEAPAEVKVEGDRGQLEMLLTNLVENALHYTPRGGVVNVHARAADGHSWLEVVDNGPGIAEEERDRVFDRFFRGSAAQSSDKPAGSGLGLAIVQAVALRHRAFVSLNAVHGSTGLLVQVRFTSPA